MFKHERNTSGIKTFASLLVLSATLALSACGSNESEGKSSGDISGHLTRGDAYREQNQLRAAIIEARNALQKAPDDPRGRILLASVYKELGQAKAAIDELYQVPGKKSPSYYFTLVEVYLMKKKFISALAVLSENPTLNEADPLKFQLLSAEANLGLSKLDDAESHFKKASALAKQSTRAQNGFAKIAYARGNHEKSTLLLDELLKSDPRNTSALKLKAKIVTESGNLELAGDLLTELIANLPKTDIMTRERMNALRNLSAVLTQQGRNNEALIYSKILADAFPGAKEVNQKYQDAVGAFDNKDFEQATNLLEEILELDPDNEKAGTLLGIVNFMKGDTSAADEFLSNYTDMETSTDVTRQIAAITKFRLGRPAEVLSILASNIDSVNDANTLGLYGLAAIASQKGAVGAFYLRKALNIDPTLYRYSLALASYENSLAEGKSSAALKILEEAQKISPSNAEINSALVKQHFNMEKTKNAEEVVADLLSKQSSDPEAHVLAGALQLNQGNAKQAIESYNKALELSPKHLGALLGLGRAEQLRKSWKSAESLFSRVLELSTGNINAYRGLISNAELQGDISKGLKQLETWALKDQGQAFSVIAHYYLKQQRPEKSASFARQALEKNPTDNYANNILANSQLLMGSNLLKQGDSASAKQSFIDGLETSPNHLALLARLCELEIKQGNHSEAQKLISRMTEGSGAHVYLNKLSGDLAMARQKFEAAAKHYRLVWDEQASDAVGQLLYQALTANEQHQSVQSFLEEWTKALPSSPAALVNIGNTALGNKDYAGAINYYRRVMELAKPTPALLNNFAWALHKDGQEDAIVFAKQATDLAPNNPNILDTYGWVLFHTGDAEGGLKVLERALELAPENEAIKGHAEHIRNTL